jgi:hypothetical protein
MPLTPDDIIHQYTSSTGAAATSTSITVTLAPGDSTDAGNTILVYINAASQINTPYPTGFVQDHLLNTAVLNCLRKPNVAAGENSWTFTMALATTAAWTVLEVEGLDLDDPVDAFSSGTANGSPQTAGTIAQNSAYDCMAVAVHGGRIASGVIGTYSGQTGGFTEIGESSTTHATASNNVLAVSTYFPGDVSSFASSATKTGTITTSQGGIVVYRAAGSRTAPSIIFGTGFEFGTHAGYNTGNNLNSLSEIWQGTAGTNIIVQAGSAKNGNYGLRLVMSNSVASYGASNAVSIPLTATTIVMGFWVRVVSATGTVVLAHTGGDATSNFSQVVYNVTTNKLGVRWITGAAPGTPGTISYQSGTTALNTWVRVDWRVWAIKNVSRKMNWALNGVEETAPADLSIVGGSGTFATALLGSATSYSNQTVTADYDDFRVSTSRIDYPLGDQRWVGLPVDPAGTVTVSGTTANFNTFTANGTMAAWNATTARGAVDELPPTIGASADGVAQVTAAASDYVEFPMSTYTLATGEKIDAVRAYLLGWGAGAPAAANIGFRAYDGTTETVLYALADPIFSNSTTNPAWLHKRWTRLPRWTQAALDAATLRMGWSTDATPDIGAHAFYLEVLIGQATTMQLFGDGAAQAVDPNGNDALVNVAVTAPVMGTGDATLRYVVGGTPTDVNVPEGTTVTETIDAATSTTVEEVTVFWPPEPDPVE